MQVVHVCHAAYQRAAPIQNNGSVAGLNETEQRYQQRALAAACAADNSNLGRVRQLEGETPSRAEGSWGAYFRLMFLN